MRASINFEFKKPITLPIQYNHIIHGAILNWVDNTECKKNKLYTFSKLQGRFTMDSKNKTITYYNQVNLLVSSYDEKFLSNMINSLVMKNNIKILKDEVEIEHIETALKSVKQDEIMVYTKSPITVYSTLTVDDKKKTYYYTPYEKEFGEHIRNNLINKYKTFHGYEPKDKSFSIELLNRRNPKESVVIYNGIVIKGWNGEFIMRGSKELLNLAYQSGVGAKNSQGFGCVEIIENYNLE